jgi:transposase
MKVSIKQKPIVKKKILPLVLTIANQFIKQLDFVKKINEAVNYDPAHWKVSPGELLKVVVLSTFMDIRPVLTRTQERFSEIDIGYFLDNEHLGLNDINEFNIGRSLERLGEANYNGLYESIALSAIQGEHIPVTRMHSDTTTLSFYGEYDIDETELTEKERSELIEIERGYNKDGRPTCKQIVVGQIVNEAGLPLVSRAMDGSTSDVEWNKQAVTYLEQIMSNGFSRGIYVSDSKLVTKEIIESLTDPVKKIQFVSRCPSSFAGKLEGRMIEKAYKTNTWEDIGVFHSGSNASTYKGVSFMEEVFGRKMRLLVLESSQLSKKAVHALEKKEAAFLTSKEEIEDKTFSCQQDAEVALAQWEKQKDTRLFIYESHIEHNCHEIWPRGRRGTNTKPKIKDTYRIKICNHAYDLQSCRNFLHSESCIVLISNVEDELSNRALLQIYKGQQIVENSFRLLKQPQLASVIYLKNPKRIEALTMLLTFSLLLRALIQYRLRDGLLKYQEEHPNEVLKVGWNDRPLKAPTYMLLYEHSINCKFEQEETGEYSFTWPSQKAENRVTVLLKLMGFTIEQLLD